MSELDQNYQNLQNDFQAESDNTEKRLKARERQINELKKELQRNIEKEKDGKVKESVKEEKINNTENSNGFQEDSPVDINYLKHVVLRYITAPSQDREHLIKALAQLLHFSPEESKLISEVLQYKKSWFGNKPAPRGAIAPSIQNVKK